jgi:hypothetical protein
MCHHRPHCPSAQANDRLAARTAAAHPEQGWSLLCNGVVIFDDNGVLLPDGCVIDPGPVRFDARPWLQSGRVGPSTQQVLVTEQRSGPADASAARCSTTIAHGSEGHYLGTRIRNVPAAA